MNLLLTAAIKDVIVHTENISEFLLDKLKNMNALNVLEKFGVDWREIERKNGTYEDYLLSLSKAVGLQVIFRS
jgi:hypothetical protein